MFRQVRFVASIWLFSLWICLGGDGNFVAAFEALTPGPEASALMNLFSAAAGVQGANNTVFLQPTQTMTAPNGMPVIVGSQSSGYASQYQDSIYPSSDQGHHFAAFFQLTTLETSAPAKSLHWRHSSRRGKTAS
jgi:hypothetical protein